MFLMILWLYPLGSASRMNFTKQNNITDTDPMAKLICAMDCGCVVSNCYGFLTENGSCSFLTNPLTAGPCFKATSPCYGQGPPFPVSIVLENANSDVCTKKSSQQTFMQVIFSNKKSNGNYHSQVYYM